MAEAYAWLVLLQACTTDLVACQRTEDGLTVWQPGCSIPMPSAKSGVLLCPCALQDYAHRLPEEARGDPRRLGAWLYSCTDCAHGEEGALGTNLPSALVQV
jgi:hypothetical protein